MAYVPQAQAMEFAYTVLDLVLMGRTAHLGPFAAPRAVDRERARAALADLGILGSRGRRQPHLRRPAPALPVARALAQDAPLLVMDEPTASLDLGNRLLVLERVRALREQGYGIVFSTHDPDQAHELATWVAVIADGRLAAYGSPQETLTGAILSRSTASPSWSSARRAAATSWRRVRPSTSADIRRPEDEGKDPAAVSLGRRGGAARAASLEQEAPKRDRQKGSKIEAGAKSRRRYKTALISGTCRGMLHQRNIESLPLDANSLERICPTGSRQA